MWRDSYAHTPPEEAHTHNDTNGEREEWVHNNLPTNQKVKTYLVALLEEGVDAGLHLGVRARCGQTCLCKVGQLRLQELLLRGPTRASK